MPSSIHSINLLKTYSLNKDLKTASNPRKRTLSADSFEPKHKVVKMIDHKKLVESEDSYREIDFLFNKLFHRSAESIKISAAKKNNNALINLDPAFSKQNLKKVLDPVFIRELLAKTKKDLRCDLEQDPCVGEYWKSLHKRSSKKNSLKNLQKLYFCLDNFSLPIPKTAKEMGKIIKAKLSIEKEQIK